MIEGIYEKNVSARGGAICTQPATTQFNSIPFANQISGRNLTF